MPERLGFFSLVFRACSESSYALAVLLLALARTCGVSFGTHPPTLHCLIQGFASIGSRRSALSLVVSGPLGLRNSGLQSSGLPTFRSPDLGAWARMPRPASTAFVYKGTHCLAFSNFRGANAPPVPGAPVPWKQCYFQQSR